MIKKDNVAAHWKLNGAVDQTGKPLDFSGKGNHLTIAGPVEYRKNNVGKTIQKVNDGSEVIQSFPDPAFQTEVDFEYLDNNCKRWDGNDNCVSSATLNIGAQDFEMGLEMRLDNLSQLTYRPYFGRWAPDGVDYAGNISIHQELGTTVYALAKSHEGTAASFGNTSTAILGTTLFHTFLLKRVGTTITFYIDGVARGSATYPATDTFMVDRNLNYRGGPCTKSRAWVDVAGVRVVDYTHAAGPALVEWDRSGNGNHGVYTTTSGIDTMATMDDNATPWNILNGFSLYTHATLDPIRVPYDINGDPLSITPPTGYTFASEHPGGVPHNGAESRVMPTDTRLVVNGFWSRDRINFDRKSYTDLYNHINNDVTIEKSGELITKVNTIVHRPFELSTNYINFTGGRCKYFNGIDNRVTIGIPPVGTKDFKLTLSMVIPPLLTLRQYAPYLGTLGGNGEVRITQGNVTRLAARVVGSDGVLYMNSTGAPLVSFGYDTEFRDGKLHTYTIERIGSVLRAVKDGVVVFTAIPVPSTTSFFDSLYLYLGGSFAGPFYPCRATLEIDGEVWVDYTCDSGPFNYMLDRSNTLTPGLIEGDTTNISVVHPEAYPHGLREGYTLYTHPISEPITITYDINGNPIPITPPEGYTLDSEHPCQEIFDEVLNNTIKQNNPLLLSNDFWSSDGINFDNKTKDDLVNCDETDGVYVSVENDEVIRVITEEEPGVFTSLSTTLDFDPNRVTITARVNCDDYYTSFDRTIFEKVSAVEDYLLNVSLVGNDLKYLTFTGPDGHGISSSSIVVNDKTDHIISCTYDGNTWSIYIDAELVESIVDPVEILNESAGCYVGKNIDSSFDGSIGDLLIHTVALTEVEVKQLHQELRNPPEFSPKMVPSLTSDGVDDYIDTGIIPDMNTFEIEVKGRLNSVTGVGQRFGLLDANATSCWFGTNFVGKKWSSNILTSQVDGTQDADTKTHVFKFNGNGLYVDDVLVSDQTANPKGVAINSFYLYKLNRAGAQYPANFLLNYVKIRVSGVLVRHMIPQKDGTFIDIVNNVIYSNSGTGTLTYKQEALELDDSSLIFSTRDGVKDLSGKSEITTTNAIIGKGIILNSGTVNWQNLTPTSYVYVWEDSSGNNKHYGYNGTLYINSIAGGSQPIIIGSTGISSVTGKLHSIKIYNEVKSAEFIEQDYLKEVRYW